MQNKNLILLSLMYVSVFYQLSADNLSEVSTKELGNAFSLIGEKLSKHSDDHNDKSLLSYLKERKSILENESLILMKELKQLNISETKSLNKVRNLQKQKGKRFATNTRKKANSEFETRAYKMHDIKENLKLKQSQIQFIETINSIV
jgi:hypothetical protein